MTTTSDRTGCDTEDMVVVHRMFRRLFRDGPVLVGNVRPGDDEHRRAVVDHLLQLNAALHNHHRTEDENLWDRLTAKAPGCGVHVQLMQAQHAAMADRLTDADRVLTAWRESGSEADAAAGLAAMSEVLRLLDEHLGDEERRILPEASRALTQKEWDIVGKAARAEKARVPAFVQPVSPMVQLGLMLDGLDEQGLKEVRRILPRPAIVLYTLLGKRRFAAYRKKVYGPAA